MQNIWSDLLLEESNLNLEMFKLLQKYKKLRKVWLNIDNFFEPLKKIKDEIEN